LVGATSIVVPGFISTTSAAEAPPVIAAKPDPSLIQQLRDNAQGSVTIAREPATKSVGFVMAGRNGDLMPDSDATAGVKADAFLNEYGAMLGATPGTIVRESVTADGLGGHTVTYVQEYRGVPVFGAMLRAHLDKQGDLTAVNGAAVPDLELSVDPRLSASEIGKRAVAYVKSDPPSHEGGKADTTGIKAVKTDLSVYREGIVRGVPGAAHLAYVVEVSNGNNIRDIVIMTAQSGKVLNRYSMVHDVLDRKVYEQDPNTTPVWEEGDPVPGSLNEDQENIVRASGESYYFFWNSFGRDSYDGAGATMRTVNNDPTINCPNANWNGVTTNYCNGVTSDDVVAHEWGHAYTEYTHGLIYQWQSGALNESYSDIWGETVDLLNNRMDDDEGIITAKRTVGACSEHTPPRPVLTINSPASIARTCQAAPASFGAPITEPGTSGDVALALDPANPAGPSTTDGCSPLTNPAEVAGKVALVDRGGCAFVLKAVNVQAAGAIAMVVGQNHPFAPSSMSGTDPSVTIPSLMISQANRFAISDTLDAGETVNVTLEPDQALREDSFRWLIGEDSTAFGGAIRDMWSPTCLNDPGRVTDAEYHCSTDDGGGVHTNSGVPNHGYALLVDGGTFNDVTVPSIGLTKAAHIYFKAMTDYQTPVSDFTDHADSLAAACDELTGTTVAGLGTDGSPEDTNSPAPLPDETITAADCEAVDLMADAVELRTEPTQCNFQPLLAPGQAPTCGPKQARNTFWSDNFESGLGNWELEEEWVFDEQDYAWSDVARLPGGRGGSAAFAPGPDEGSCSGGPGDISGQMWLTSEPILVPGTNQRNPRLTFDHYVATEAGFDGGNVKIAVNGGEFETVPADAFTFNDYNTVLATAAAGNTNPLQGQPGFSGTDGGEVTGTWGESQVDLSALGIKSGDVFQVRFAFGMDGCGGNDGWYVDDVRISTCQAQTEVSAHRPRPTPFGQSPRVQVDVESIGGFGAPTGTVVAVKGGRVLAEAELRRGTATLDLTPGLAVGTHDVAVRYLGDDLHAGSADRVAVRIVKGATRATLDMQPSPVSRGERVFADVDVNGSGFTPTGRVVLKKGNQVVARGVLDDGEKQFILNAVWAPGTHTFKVQYVGNRNMSASSDRDSLRITRR
jgi:Zn-dependent metalloprotease